MKGILKPIDYSTKQQDVNHVFFGKSVTIIEQKKYGYWYSIDDFPNNKENLFFAPTDEIEIIDNPTEKGGGEE